MLTTSAEITRLLRQAREGNSDAESLLVRLVYPELRKMARNFMRRERADHTLQPTAVVHEAYLKMFDGKQLDYQDRIQFLKIAGEQMRKVLVDHGRKHRALKRGQGWKVQLDEGHDAAGMQSRDATWVVLLLEKLQKADPAAARVTELKFFTGLTDAEVSSALGVTQAHVRREWSFAKAWLKQRIEQVGEVGAPV